LAGERVLGIVLPMSVLTATLPPGDFFRLSVKQYHELIDRGILGPDDKVELLEGILVRKMSKNEPHILAVRRCRKKIEKLLPASHFYEAEQPIVLADGEPEPGGVVITGTPDDPRLAKPMAADIPLVIEVADTSLERDRLLKRAMYARAGIPCYWIVNLIDRQIEVYTQPNAAAEVPTYPAPVIFKPGDSVPFKIGDQLIAEIPVAQLLPGT